MGIFQRSLTVRLLTYFLLLAIVPLVAVGFLAYNSGRQAIISRVEAHMVMGIIFVVAAVVGVLFARSINQPIKQLLKATEEVARGNLGYRVAVKNKDGIGQLGAAFNQMAGALEKSEKSLNLSERRYRGVFENAGEAIMTFDRAEVVQSWNRAAEEMFGYKAEEIVGHTFHSLVPEDLLKKGELEQLRKEAEGTGKRVRHETQRIRKDGARIEIALTRSALRDDEGNIVGFMAILNDITERKQIQEKLIASERLAILGQVSGSISHEIRNPLGVIGSSAYYLKTKLKDSDEKVLEHLDRIKSGVGKATAIVESLLNLTRMKEPQFGGLDLIAVIHEAIATSKMPAKVNVIRNFPEQEILVSADAEQLRMALANIVKNAVEAMDRKGTLTVTVSRTTGGQAEVSFADTGPGITAENLDRVFQPLFSTKADGIGFGLSIAKMVVDKHGGTIKAKSEPGEGAVITIALPLYAGKGKEA